MVTIPHLCGTKEVCVSNTIVVHLELVYAIHIGYLESCFIFTTLLSLERHAHKWINTNKFKLYIVCIIWNPSPFLQLLYLNCVYL